MKKMNLSILLFVFLSLSFNVFAAQINSSSYKQNVIVSTGGENITSSSYNMGVAIGIINRIINSTSYINKLGFFHLLLLANDQPCTSANQCEGGFCCGSLCKSSACPGPPRAPSGGGGAAASGGGGGGGIGNISSLAEKEKPRGKDFSVSSKLIKEELKLGLEKTITIKVKNTGDVQLRFDLSVETVRDFMSLSATSFTLESNEEKEIIAKIIGRKIGSYLGEIKFSADGMSKSVIIIIDVESEQALFDAKIDIPTAYEEVEAGNELKSQITLINVGTAAQVDVIVTYLVKDKRGNIIYESSETFAVEKQKSYVKSIKIPKGIKPDDYLAVIEVRYENQFAVSSEIFRVVEAKKFVMPPIPKSRSVFAVALVILVAFVFLCMYLLTPPNFFKKLLVRSKKK